MSLPRSAVTTACRVLGSRRHGTRARPRVALTFDDGPSERTAELLDVLATCRATATFFLVASSVPGGQDLVQRMIQAGHEVGSHGLHHRDMSGSARRARIELRAANRVLTAAVGAPPTLFRPPYGASSVRLVATARALGLRTVLWDVDPEDWRGHDARVTRIAAASARPGSIVLLHEAPFDTDVSGVETIRALPGIIGDLRTGGFRLVTCSELLAR